MFSLPCYSFLKAVATEYCDTDLDSNHIPGKERVLLPVSDVKFLRVKYILYLPSYAKVTQAVSLLHGFHTKFGSVRISLSLSRCPAD